MTRILSELLQASEPHFRLQLRQLESVSGHENTDIKLSVEVLQAAKQKIHSLGLDKNDTTPEELYHTLVQRVSADDRRLERALRTHAATYVSAEADLMAGMVHALEQESVAAASFALKPAAVKRHLKKLAPKRVTKALGYRSLDAMLRNESPAALVAAALVLESAAWRRSWIDSYKQLRPADFESRAPRIICPDKARWQALTIKIVSEQAHTVLTMPELGTIILLPLPAERPDGSVVATMALALHDLNSLEASSNYLRASQVHGDFAKRVQAVATGNVALATPLLHESVSWQLVQQYFARTKAAISEDVFGPHVQAADFAWHNVELVLSKLCPSMAFWEDTAYLSFLQEGRAVSMNILDVAINSCNRVAFEARSLQHAQKALWNELTVRYLNHESIEQAVSAVLQPQLALEMATNE